MVNPYFIIAAMIAVGGAYGYGHHVGWGDRDAEMQVEIAKKNDEAREKETQLAQQLNEQSTKLSEANNVINQKQSSLDRAVAFYIVNKCSFSGLTESSSSRCGRL